MFQVNQRKIRPRIEIVWRYSQGLRVLGRSLGETAFCDENIRQIIVRTCITRIQTYGLGKMRASLIPVTELHKLISQVVVRMGIPGINPHGFAQMGDRFLMLSCIRELIRNAIAKTYDQYFAGANMQQVIQWFDLGGEIQIAESAPAADLLQTLRGIQGLMDKLTRVNVGPKDNAEAQVSAAEFILEGLYALKRIGRNEERVFTAGEKQPRATEKPYERDELPYRTRRPLN